MPIRPHMNPLVSLLIWSIKGMRKEVPSASGRVGLAILPYPFRFFSWKVGHTSSCGQLCGVESHDSLPAGISLYIHRWVYRENPHCREYTIYFPGSAFDVRGCYGTNSDKQTSLTITFIHK